MTTDKPLGTDSEEEVVMNVGIYIYDQAEVLDFSGPFEVFATASRVCPASDPFQVFLVGETGGTIAARNGYSVNPAYGFHNHPSIDVLIVAGGVHTEEMAKANVIAWLAATAQQTTITASVCTGAFLLAEARILTTQKATTHWEDIPDLRTRYPDLGVEASVRWVDGGAVVTSAGISAAQSVTIFIISRFSWNKFLSL